MKYLLLIAALFFVSTMSHAQSVSCLYGAVNQSQRMSFAQFGVIQGFGPGCLVVQQDTSTLYMWDGSQYNLVSGAGIGLTSLNSQLGQTQIFANDTNITLTSSNNTHSLGFTGTLSLVRGGSGAALTAINGGVVYSDASKLNVLAAGTSGQCLTSSGAGSPAWASCGGGGSGLTSLNSQTGSTQIFANDTNMTITSSNNTHTLAWAGTLSLAKGGSGAALTAAAGRVIYSGASALTVMSTTGTSGQLLQSAGTSSPTWIRADSTGAASSIAKVDSGSYITARNYYINFDSINAPGGPVQLTGSNGYVQVVTNSSATTIIMPTPVTSPAKLFAFMIVNNSVGLVTVQDSASNTIAVIAAGGVGAFTESGVSPEAWVVSMNGLPTVATNLGSAGFIFNAEVSSTGTVSGENVDWITSNCALSSSVFTCTITTGLFAGTPKCHATIHGSTSGQVSVNPGSATSIVVSTFAGTSGLAGDRAFTISCSD